MDNLSLSTIYPYVLILMRVGGTILVLLVGRRLARMVRIWVELALSHTGLTETLEKLFSRIAYYGVLFLTIILALTLLGIPITATLTVLGIAIIVLGIALQESLANFAATILFLLFQPYKVGDLVQTAGIMGTVKEIQIFYTVFITFDNKTVTVPNGKVQDSNIINYSHIGILRADVDVSVSYSDNLPQAKRILEELLATDDRVLPDPPPRVVIVDFGDSGIEMSVRPFVGIDDYWDIQFDLRERIKERFDAEGITIPFPQRDVHMVSAP